MRKVLIVLALAAAFAFAVDNVRVEGLSGTGSDDLLQYDDGTPNWIFGGLAYFGTWFDITDFLPSATDFSCNYIEMTFYHHSNLPWDTDMLSVELWTGDAAMPMTQLWQEDITALHYTAQVFDFDPAISTGTDFWFLGNTTIYSSTGYPSGLYDAGGNFTGTPHTFGSQDWILWDPLIPTGGTEDVDFLVRAEGDLPLDSESWGAIKGLYR